MGICILEGSGAEAGKEADTVEDKEEGRAADTEDMGVVAEAGAEEAGTVAGKDEDMEVEAGAEAGAEEAGTVAGKEEGKEEEAVEAEEGGEEREDASVRATYHENRVQKYYE